MADVTIGDDDVTVKPEAGAAATQAATSAPGKEHEAASAGGAARAQARSDPWIDYTELAAAARAQRRSPRKLLGILRECWRLVWGTNRRIFVASACLQLVGGVVVAAQVLITKVVLQQILSVDQSGGSATNAVPAIIALAAVTSFSSISRVILAQQSRMLSDLTTRATWNKILDVAGAVDLLAYEGSAFYDQLQRVQANATNRPYMLVQGVIGLIGGVAGTVGVAVAVIAIQPILLPLLLLSGIPLWFSSRRSSQAEFSFVVAQNEQSRKRAYLSAILTARDAAKEIRAFGLFSTLRARYNANYEEYLSDLQAHVRRKSRIGVVGNIASAGLLAGTLVILILLIAHHEVGLAAAGAALVAIRMLGSQIAGLFGGLQQMFESSLFMEDLRHFLSITPRLEKAQAGLPAPEAFRRLDVDAVTFTYPGSSSPALRAVSMKVSAGQIVALVGENGSGKTTLAKALAGLYEPDEGAIRWDDVDIARFDRQSLRKSIAVIFQDFVRYQLSAADNVGAGRPEAIDNFDEIAAAAKHAGAHDFLESLPDGYRTLLSKVFKGGLDLSLGQWQRVALARAFYRDAPFIILDEPTASLDPRAEADLFAKIRELLAGRTVLLISHRFSSVRYADIIHVMHRGEIVESGTHSELMGRGGRYADLFSLQAAAYIDPAAS